MLLGWLLMSLLSGKSPQAPPACYSYPALWGSSACTTHMAHLLLMAGLLQGCVGAAATALLGGSWLLWLSLRATWLLLLWYKCPPPAGVVKHQMQSTAMILCLVLLPWLNGALPLLRLGWLLQKLAACFVASFLLWQGLLAARSHTQACPRLV